MHQDKRRRALGVLGPRPDIDVEDEIAFHLEMRAKELMAMGLSATEAREEARRRFGDRTRVEAEMRRMERERLRRATRLTAFRDLRGDVVFAVRSLARQPLFTLAAVLTLGLSIGANTAIFSAINAYLLKPMPVRDPDRIVAVAAASKRDDLVGNIAWPVRDELVKLGVFEDAVAWTGWEVALRKDQSARRGFVLAPSGNYFSMLGIQPALGRLFTQADAQARNPVVVLTDAYWAREFNRDRAVIGRSLFLNDVPYTVIGVAPPSFKGTQPLILPDVFLPIESLTLIAPDIPRQLADMTYGSFRILARLKPGVSVEQARLAVDQLTTEMTRRFPDAMVDQRFIMELERRTRPEFAVAKLMPWVAGAFFGMVGLALLVACANVTNLLLARATARQSEIAVRSALGAAPGRVVRLLLTESLLLGVAGLVVAYLLARYCVHWFMNLPLAIDVPLDFGLTVDWRVFAYAAAISLVAGVLAGLAPAVMGARTPVSDVLRESGRSGTSGKSRARLRAGLVVAQVAISFVLLVCAGLFMRSAGQAARLDLGFSRERLLLGATSLELHRIDSTQVRGVQDRIIDAVSALPGVEHFALASTIPLSGNFNTSNIFIDERPAAAPDGKFNSGSSSVTPGFVAAIGHRLVAGRDFTPQDDTLAPKVAIVNKVFAEAAWPGRDAVGQHFRLDAKGPPVEVVGVIDNAQYVLLGEQPRFMTLLPLRQHPASQTILLTKTRGADPSAMAGELRRAVASVNPNILVYGVRTMGAHLDQGIALFFVNIGATLAGAIGLLGLLQTLVGLYGVLSYSVAQRAREFGIRQALGASALDVIRDVLRQGSVLVAAGLVAGGLLAIALTRVLGSILVGVSATDLLVYVGALVVVAVMALFSSFIPAWRASRVAPATAIRRD